MPLDKVLIKHLDDQDYLEDSLDKDIDQLLSKVTISELMSDVEGVLMSIVQQLQERLESQYYEKAVANGIELAHNIQDDGDIRIQDTNNADLNG